jgi:ketosteroid isomerase-like protein
MLSNATENQPATDVLPLQDAANGGNTMGKKSTACGALILSTLSLVALTGATYPERDSVGDPFLEEQEEVREVIRSIVQDAESANIEGLKAAHLKSDKFTKFGPRSFDRQDLASTNQSEAAFFGSISNFRQENRELKIDVFGDMAIATYYPHVSFVQNGEVKERSGRQTLVLLKTPEGWKIVHEHGTARQW